MMQKIILILFTWLMGVATGLGFYQMTFTGPYAASPSHVGLDNELTVAAELGLLTAGLDNELTVDLDDAASTTSSLSIHKAVLQEIKLLDCCRIDPAGEPVYDISERYVLNYVTCPNLSIEGRIENAKARLRGEALSTAGEARSRLLRAWLLEEDKTTKPWLHGSTPHGDTP